MIVGIIGMIGPCQAHGVAGAEVGQNRAIRCAGSGNLGRRAHDPVRHVSQLVGCLNVLHGTSIKEDTLYVRQLLQRPSQLGDVHGEANVRGCVLPIVDAQGLASRNPSAGVGPEVERVVLCREFADDAAQVL